MSGQHSAPVTDHIALLHQALVRLDLTPAQVRWHYIQLVFQTNGRNVTNTAKALCMHRRTLQRVLAKNRPVRGEAENG